MVKTLLFFFFFVMSAVSFSQSVTVYGSFQKDSIAIGEPVVYSLAARYTSNQNILFPDSTYNFSPFEFSKKIFFPTKTTEGYSFDSAVYYLSTFEVDSIQYLSLPVFTVHPSDCTVTSALRDSILLREMVALMPPDTVSAQNLPLKVDLLYNPVDYLLNYPVIGLVVGGLLILILIIWLIFGKRIKKYFSIKKLRRNYHTFITDYNSMIGKVTSQFSPEGTEHALARWKRYMEVLESKPYTKITTREAMKLFNDQTLVTTLSKLDAAVYGHNTLVEEPLKNLGQYAEQKFNAKLEAIKHG
ncbi:MAG: hypothetical protein L0Y35_08800 [Flammeovirgaceae bacterium]|nr:hypothetical protein [Flammeovirgaceae bacterium]